jgi:putative FmdB family regulatory protein
MPLYEYECANGHRFEKIQKFSDPLQTTCPTCGASVQKLISSPAIQFKGTGWYITDYAKKDSAAAGKTDKSDGSAEAKSDSKADATTESSKTETKVETKTETKAESRSDSPATAKAEKT